MSVEKGKYLQTLLQGYFTWTLSLPLLMAMYLELLLDWLRVIEKAPLTVIQKAYCSGSSRVIDLD